MREVNNIEYFHFIIVEEVKLNNLSDLLKREDY